MNAKKDFHTCSDDLPQSVKCIQKAVKVINHLSTPLATKLVTQLFCKPMKRRIKKKQERFYQSGTTDVLRIRGYKVKVFRKGTGKAVYVAHGWNCSGYGMRHIVDALVTAGYQVIMPDMPCHGRSSGIFVNQIEMSKVIEELLLHYHAQYPVEQIVSYSWGGTATLLALDRIRKRNLLGFNIKKMVSVSMPTRPDAIMDIFIRVLDLPQAVAQGFKRNIESVAKKDGRSLKEAFPLGLEGLLKRGTFDYLLLHGRCDEAIPFKNSLQLANKFSHIRTCIFEGLGHIDIVKDRQVSEAIVDHLSERQSKAAVQRKLAAAI